VGRATHCGLRRSTGPFRPAQQSRVKCCQRVSFAQRQFQIRSVIHSQAVPPSKLHQGVILHVCFDSYRQFPEQCQRVSRLGAVQATAALVYNHNITKLIPPKNRERSDPRTNLCWPGRVLPRSQPRGAPVSARRIAPRRPHHASRRKPCVASPPEWPTFPAITIRPRLRGEGEEAPRPNAIALRSSWAMTPIGQPLPAPQSKGAHFRYSTSPAITMGSDRGSLNGVQLCVLPCMSVATTR
jgi:hypothetical protein